MSKLTAFLPLCYLADSPLSGLESESAGAVEANNPLGGQPLVDASTSDLLAQYEIGCTFWPLRDETRRRLRSGPSGRAGGSSSLRHGLGVDLQLGNQACCGLLGQPARQGA